VGSERRIYAAVKFFLFTFVGSVLMLLAIFYLWSHFRSGRQPRTFDYVALQAQMPPLGADARSALPRFAIAFPQVPSALHTGCPTAHRGARRRVDRAGRGDAQRWAPSDSSVRDAAFRAACSTRRPSCAGWGHRLGPLMCMAQQD